MLKFNRTLLATSALLAVAAFPAVAASVPLLTGPGGSNPANFPADLPDINNTINAVNSSGSTGINTNTMAAYSTPRNFLDNGSINVAQRGTSAIQGVSTCNVTGSTQAYTADRWCVESSVASSAAAGTVVTSSPTPLQGFTNSLNITRASGALTATICGIQEVQTSRAIALQGQTATFSVYLQALAGMSADNSNAATLIIFTGTGSDQGLQTNNAAQDSRPAWTGLANAKSQAVTLTTGWVRYTATGTIPAAATEVGVAICFQPQAGSGGTTDGLAMVGAQLEVGNTPSAFEYKNSQAEIAEAQRYFWRLNESSVSQSLQGFVGLQNSSLNCVGYVNFPQTMRIAPSYTNQLSATTFAIVGTHLALGSGSALTTTFSGLTQTSATTVNSASMKFFTNSGTGILNGDQCMLESVAGSGKLDFSADF